jgi:hypothetical protein
MKAKTRQIQKSFGEKRTATLETGNQQIEDYLPSTNHFFEEPKLRTTTKNQRKLN